MILKRLPGGPGAGLAFVRQAARFRKGSPAPLFASLFVTGRCNLRCAGCFFFNGFPATMGDMEPAVASAAPMQIARAGIPVCFLVGGEPLLHPGLFDIADDLKKRGVQPVLFTNGTLVDPAMARRIAGVFSRVFVSVDGTLESNDLRRGAGSFDKAVAAVHNLQAQGRFLHVSVRCVVSRQNLDSIEEFLARMRQEGVRAVSLQPDSFPENLPGPAAGPRLTDLAVSFSNILAENPEDLAIADKYLRDGRTPACAVSSLGHIGILPDGTVSACCEWHVPVGNLVDTDLSILVARARADSAACAPGCHGCCRADTRLLRTIETGRLIELFRGARSALKKA